MDNLLIKSRLNQQSKFNQRIFWLHNIINRRIYFNTPRIVHSGDGIFLFHHEEKKKILKEVKMKENNLVGILTWIIGILVALAVGAGMIGPNATLTIPGISAIGNGIIVTIAGWVVVIGAILSLILTIFNK